MSNSSTLHARRLGVSVTALALGVALATPVAAAPAKDGTDCIDYAGLAQAPAGTIPRDDLHVVRKDPLAQAARAATTARAARGGKGSTALAAFVPVEIP